MNITTLTPLAYEFACKSRDCAPPPVGTGGSRGGGMPRYNGPRLNFKTPEHHTDHSGSGGKYRAMRPKPNKGNVTSPRVLLPRPTIKYRAATTAVKAAFTQPTRARPKVRMSANGVPWANPNQRHAPHMGDSEHPQPIFQAPKKAMSYWGTKAQKRKYKVGAAAAALLGAWMVGSRA